MPDREKVISKFEKIISVCKEDGCDFVDLSFEDAEQILALLKEQKEIKEQFTEAFNTIRDAYNTPANREKILLNYLLRNACCCSDGESR